LVDFEQWINFKIASSNMWSAKSCLVMDSWLGEVIKCKGQIYHMQLNKRCLSAESIFYFEAQILLQIDVNDCIMASCQHQRATKVPYERCTIQGIDLPSSRSRIWFFDDDVWWSRSLEDRWVVRRNVHAGIETCIRPSCSQTMGAEIRSRAAMVGPQLQLRSLTIHGVALISRCPLF